MKLFELEIGNIRAFASAETQEEMEERKAEVDATFAFLPVVIREVTLDGYDITVTPIEQSIPGSIIEYREDQQHIVNMTRDELKKFLKEKGVEFTPQWGRDKLLELALQE